MTDQEIAQVQASLARISPNAEWMAAGFYHRLFTAAPQMRDMFPRNMQEQRRKLVLALALAIGGLRRIPEILPQLHDLGARHVGYGVEPHHYALVGEVLIDTVKAVEGKNWSDALEEAWLAAYALVSGAMLEGARAEAQRAA